MTEPALAANRRRFLPALLVHEAVWSSTQYSAELTALFAEPLLQIGTATC